MSEELISPNIKFDRKSSLKKPNKADQSKSKKKTAEMLDPIKSENDKNTLETSIEEKPDPRLQSKSSKREALQNKGDSKFKEHLKQAEKSEVSAKIMKSTDKASTIKEHHNHVESNQRQFSLSKQPEQTLQVSKKKMATESKKTKILETDTKHPKTEEKTNLKPNEPETKEQTKITHQEVPTVDHSEHQPEMNETIAEIMPADHQTEPKEDMIVSATGEKASRKRVQLAHSNAEVEDHSQDAKKSKSVKKGSKSVTKSKDSKMLAGKSGVKKLKPNEEGTK